MTLRKAIIGISTVFFLFTSVIGQTLTVTSPNGGEIWPAGSLQSITWNSNNTSGAVKIDYTVDDGVLWGVIDHWTADDGIYYWSPPNVQSSKCIVRVTDTDGSPGDQSDAYFTIKNGTTQHFHTVWEGENPFQAMNIYIINAQIDGIDLRAGDEIGIFDENQCVGATVLQDDFPPAGTLHIPCGAYDSLANVNGFIQGNPIIFKIWDEHYGEELNADPAYFNCTTGNPTTPSLFTKGGAACVELSSIALVTQTIHLIAGWNMFSLAVDPQSSHDMLDMLNSIQSHLLKVVDENGDTVEKVFGNWQNFIGDWQSTEGYYIKVDAELDYIVTGRRVRVPLEIPLMGGWNMISYDCLELEQDAIDVMQSLIDAGYLLKVIDEMGLTVEWLFGSWHNYIGNMRAGEGYYVKTTQPCTYVMSCNNPGLPKIVSRLQPKHFATLNAHPFKPMSLYIFGESLNGKQLLAGDEIAAFKEGKCLGTTVWLNENMPVLLPIGGDDGSGIGYIQNEKIELRLWRQAENCEEIVKIDPQMLYDTAGRLLDRELIYNSLESVVLMSRNDLKTSEKPSSYELFQNFPNPFNATTKIHYTLPQRSEIQITVHDVRGRMVKELYNGEQNTGYHSLIWDGTNDNGINVGSGLYVYKIKSTHYNETKKMILIR